MRSNAAEYFRKLSPLKGGTMFEKDGYRSNGRSGRCHCCPYGYHIDLDFVRYCQALNQGAKNDNPTVIELKRMKKARRRQTKSMEAMLGLPAPDEDKAWFKEQNHNSHMTIHESKTSNEQAWQAPTPPPREKKKFFSPPSPPPRKQSLTHPALRSPPPPDIINSSSLLLNRRSEAASDTLQEAVLDFEEILESSKEQPRRKSRLERDQPYATIDLLHHTPPHSSHTHYLPKAKTSGATVARSNSLPRQWTVNKGSLGSLPFPFRAQPSQSSSGFQGEEEGVRLFRTSSGRGQEGNLPFLTGSLDTIILHDSASFSRQPFHNHKEPLGMSQSYTYSNNGYSYQSPLINDAMAALNAAQGFSANRIQDFDTMSVTSAMSGVSTTTLQSIRDQMATGLSRLKDLEEEVRGIPSMQTRMDILQEEKRILMEQLRCAQKGQEAPPVPFSLERDAPSADASPGDLETRLEALRKFSVDKDRRRSDRRRSPSPMRVNLQDFHSYRRARRGSLSEGSDTESVHSYRGRERSRDDNDDTCLHISELSDYPTDSLPTKKSCYSLPGTPSVSRRGCKDAAVSCKVLTRDVGVSHVAPRSRSIGTITDRVEEDKKRELKPKPCLQCFRRNQKTFESRSVGTTSPKQDSGHLSISSLSNESLGPDEVDAKLQEHDMNSKNALLMKLGKKSPIISRLSSPQLFPPVLTFDNSTNTEPLHQRDQRVNTSLRMDDFFTREQLNELIEDAKRQWEASNRSLRLHKEPRKPVMHDRGMQTVPEPSVSKFKPILQHVGVTAKPATRDAGVGYSSIDPPVEVKEAPKRMRSVGCGGEALLGDVFEKPRGVAQTRSVGVGDGRLTDTACPECRKRSLSKHVRSVSCGDGRISDLLCDKCATVSVRSVGVGDARVTDETCAKCKMKRTAHSSCQVTPPSRSVGVEANLPPTPSKTPSLVSTPEVERRPFGSSGVRVCDKCHDTITSVAKDIVSSGGPSSAVIAAPQISKIPRLVEAPKVEQQQQKSPPKAAPEPAPVAAPPAFKSRTLDSPLKQEPPKGLDLLSSSSSSVCVKSEKPFFKTEEKLVLKPAKSENLSTSSSVVSSSLPSITSSPQVKRVPYQRQETYTKPVASGAGGFVNLAFDERVEAAKNDLKEKAKAKLSPPRKRTPEKPPREAEQKAKESEAVIKGMAEQKSSSSSSSSSSSDDEDQASLVESCSIATTDATSLRASTDTVPKERKKSQPSRGMKAALKVLNDSIGKPVRSGQQLTNAINIIQREWFKVSSQKDADPLSVEEYMDAFEEYSRSLLQRVVNLSDINGNTAMHYAVSHGNFDVVSVLLNSKVCNINQQNKAGYTATMLVALAQIRNEIHESVVRKLFESGDVNIKASQHGQTALMLAVSHGRLDMVRMLISAGANPSIQDEDGSTALMCAAEHGHLAIVQYLVTQPDTDLYLMDNDGSTALTIAVEAGHKDVGVLLYKQMNLSRGSSPYSSVRGGKRPRTPTMARSNMTPPPRSSAPSSPGRSRKSSGRVSPAHARQSSASLSNLIL